MSKIEAKSPQCNVQEGQRLMIIYLERYNEIRELLIENRTTGLQGHMLSGCRPEGICNYGSCPHRGRGDGDANKEQGTYNWPLSRE